MIKKFEELKAIAENQIDVTLKELPDELQVAADIPIILEKTPSKQDVKDGIDFDVLGLFVGPSIGEVESSSSGEAPHILLYLENIWAESGEDLEIFEEEVRITLLHELGHYFNWDEDDLAERGLE